MRLPQLRTLAELQGALGVPVQVGGSFARGESDAFSDLDLTFEPPPGWTVESLGGLLVGVQHVALEERTLLHAIARGGTVVDLLPGPPPPGAIDARELVDPITPTFRPEPLESGVLVDYWIHTHKHWKPLARGLDMMVVLGLAHDRTFLMRLLSIQGGQGDPGPNLGGIYALSSLVERLMSPSLRWTLGMPTQTYAEIVAAIDAIQQTVAGLGIKGAQNTQSIVRLWFAAYTDCDMPLREPDAPG